MFAAKVMSVTIHHNTQQNQWHCEFSWDFGAAIHCEQDSLSLFALVKMWKYVQALFVARFLKSLNEEGECIASFLQARSFFVDSNISMPYPALFD